MEPISDVVESIKFMPGRPGKLFIRLLRHREPVVVLYTIGNPETHGDVVLSIDGMFILDHHDLLQHLVNIPDGQTLCVKFYPRQDLEGIGTQAEFFACDPDSIFHDMEAHGEVISRDSGKNLAKILEKSLPGGTK